MPPRPQRLLERVAAFGASAQAAIPGLYAWAITVAPAAWSRGAPFAAKVAAILGVIALASAPVIESGTSGASRPAGERSVPNVGRASPFDVRRWGRPALARGLSVWGFVLSSAAVWALVPAALSSARLDAVRGALGMVGWALFAFASAGPALKPDLESPARIIASTSMKPRTALPRGDGAYVAIGVVLALAMQGIGWGVALAERAVLVRLVTVVCGIAVLSGSTSIALARHAPRVRPTRAVWLRRSLPWFLLLLVVLAAGLAIGMAR